MTHHRVAAGMLVAALLLFVLVVAVWQARDFERISGVTRIDEGAEEATLQGSGRSPSGPAPAERDRQAEAGAAAEEPGSWRVRGRVVDLHHDPVAGVAVRTGKDGPAGLTSGADGTFTFRTTRDVVTCLPDAEGTEGHGRTATRANPDITLQVIRLLSLAVTVLDENGQPAAGISGQAVHTYTSATRPHGGHSMSGGVRKLGPADEAGRLALRLPESTDYLRLEAARGGAFAREHVRFPYRREVVLRLRPRLLIRGEVVDAAGTRVEPDGRLVARPLDSTRSTVSDPDGEWMVEEELTNFVETDGEARPEEPAPELPEQFGLTVPGAGPWLVHFEPATRGLARSEAVLVTAPAIDVRLVCRPAVAISGRVLEVGAHRFHVRWLPAREGADPDSRTRAVTAEADGTFRLWRLVAGPGRLYAWHPADGRYALVEGLRAPVEDLRVALRQGATLVGRIQTPAPPAGLEKATFWIQAVQGDLSRCADVRQAGEFTDPEDVGTFRIPGLPSGRYDLYWQWRGPWSDDSGAWVPFTAAEGVDPGAGPVTLPAPR